MQYIADRSGGGSTSVLAYVDYFSAAPGNGWKAIGSVTEFDIFKLRRSGGIPAQPRVVASNGRSGKFPTAAGTGTTPALTRQLSCIGPELVWTLTGDNSAGNRSITAAPLHTAVNNAAATCIVALTGGGPTIQGLCFANGEIHVLSSEGIYAGVPSMPNYTVGAGWTSGAALSASITRYGTTAINSNTGYNQLTFGAGVYVAWQAGGGQVLRYSSDRITWSACSVAALNADGSAAGNTIADLKFDTVQQKFIGISVYGEIIESTDGITFTKTATRAAGGTTYGLTILAVTKDGVLLAAGTGAGAGQYYVAASNAGPFALATAMTSVGFTFPNRVLSVAYSAGVAFFAFNGAISTDALMAFSRDERLTYEVSVAGDSSANLNQTVLAAAGVAALINTGTQTGLAGRLTTDWGNMIGVAVHNDFYSLPAGAGTRYQPYVKVA